MSHDRIGFEFGCLAPHELVAAFWAGIRDEHTCTAERDGRPVNVRDIAVRDAAGTYVGCVEMGTWAD